MTMVQATSYFNIFSCCHSFIRQQNTRAVWITYLQRNWNWRCNCDIRQIHAGVFMSDSRIICWIICTLTFNQVDFSSSGAHSVMLYFFFILFTISFAMFAMINSYELLQMTIKFWNLVSWPTGTLSDHLDQVHVHQACPLVRTQVVIGANRVSAHVI